MENGPQGGGSKVKVDASSQMLRMVKPKGAKGGKMVEKPLERLFGMGVGFGHLDDVIDGIGTFVSYRAPSVLAHITNGCFDTQVCGVRVRVGIKVVLATLVGLCCWGGDVQVSGSSLIRLSISWVEFG